VLLLNAEWASMPLQYLDLSFNKLQESIPDSWKQVGAGTLGQSLQTLLLNNNQLAGNATSLGSMQALSCWSVASNWGLCGVTPGLPTCGNANGTKLGRLEAPGCYYSSLADQSHSAISLSADSVGDIAACRL
jgi:hypothetical protein